MQPQYLEIASHKRYDIPILEFFRIIKYKLLDLNVHISVITFFFGGVRHLDAIEDKTANESKSNGVCTLVFFDLRDHCKRNKKSYHIAKR